MKKAILFTVLSLFSVSVMAQSATSHTSHTTTVQQNPDGSVSKTSATRRHVTVHPAPARASRTVHKRTTTTVHSTNGDMSTTTEVHSSH